MIMYICIYTVYVCIYLFIFIYIYIYFYIIIYLYIFYVMYTHVSCANMYLNTGMRANGKRLYITADMISEANRIFDVSCLGPMQCRRNLTPWKSRLVRLKV